MFVCLSSFKQERNTEWNSPKLRKRKKEIKRVYSTVITVYVYIYIFIYSKVFHDIPCICMLDGENHISNIWCLILMCSPCLPWFGSELLAKVTKWRQNALRWATRWDSDCWSCCNREKNPKLVNRLNRILNVTPGLAWFLYVFYQSHQLHHDHQHPHQSSIIDHRDTLPQYTTITFVTIIVISLFLL